MIANYLNFYYSTVTNYKINRYRRFILLLNCLNLLQEIECLVTKSIGTPTKYQHGAIPYVYCTEYKVTILPPYYSNSIAVKIMLFLYPNYLQCTRYSFPFSSPTKPLRVLSKFLATKPLLLIPQHLKRHRHPTPLMPQNMTMQRPNTCIVSQKPNNHVPPWRHVNRIFP